MFKIVAVIPARGGSKSIKYKNIVPLNGKPLIWYVIIELLKVSDIDLIIVSTDNKRIKKVVNGLFGNRVRILDRPDNISDDVATSESVLEHVIYNLDFSYTHMMLVQCTSPLTEASDFSNLIFKINEGYNSAAFYSETDSFFFNFPEDFDNLVKPRLPKQKKDLRKLEAGNAWIFEIKGFLKYGSRLFGNIGTCKIDPPKELEIDEPGDLILAECLLKRRKK